MWFNEKDFIFENRPLIKENIYGYVLPHAGSKYTSDIYCHTLQFIPKQINFDKIYIFYYPSQSKENVNHLNKVYFHEYYVPWQSLKLIFKNWWKIPEKKFIGINMNNITENIDLNNALIIISADFSHYIPMQKAIKLENKAAHSLLFKTHNSSQTVVDDMKQFNFVFNLIPNYVLRWIGRTRSPGNQAVGYLSFLITKKHIPRNPDGFFVTAYDINMNTRECLGNWEYSINNVKKLLYEVYEKAIMKSRLTNGKYRNIPVKHFIITYLYKDNKNKFIRGYHGIKGNAFYLSDVFLENTFENGKWINQSDITWPSENEFDLTETKKMLMQKSNTNMINELTYYKCYPYYLTIE